MIRVAIDKTYLCCYIKKIINIISSKFLYFQEEFENFFQDYFFIFFIYLFFYKISRRAMHALHAWRIHPCLDIYISCTLRICNQLASTPYSNLSKMNLNIGHFTLNAMPRKAKTLDIELKIKHVSRNIFI